MENVVREYIVKLIEKKGRLPEVDLDSFDYIETGYVDSIGIIKFILDIESRFDIEIQEDEMMSDDFRTIGGIVSLVESKLMAAGKS